MSKENRITLTRLDILVVVFIVMAVIGALVYSKVVEASEVELTPVPAVDKVEPVEEEPPGAIDRLRQWIKSMTEKDDPTPPPVVKMEGQKLSTDTADELAKIFDDKSKDNTERIITDAKFDAKQIDCLVRNQVFEAAGESKLGQLWVYHVVRNRTLMQYRDNETMCETIFDPKQFSWANTDPDRVPKFKADVDAAMALVNELYYDPELEDITCGATHYLKKNVMWDVDWSREALLGKSDEDLELIAIIGAHAFFGKPSC